MTGEKITPADERDRLLGWLTEYVRGSLSFAEFHERFYYHYVNELVDDSLSRLDWDFFGKIHEKMDFVAPDPDQASRADGWISTKEFKAWVGERLKSFIQDGD
jgi:hypothetical protein